MDKLQDREMFDKIKQKKEIYNNNVSYTELVADVVEQPKVAIKVLCKSCSSHYRRGGCYCKWGQHNKKNREHDEICTKRNHMVSCTRYVPIEE